MVSVARRTASAPLAASPTTSNPSRCSSSRRPCRTIVWSSASSTRVAILGSVVAAIPERIRQPPQLRTGNSPSRPSAGGGRGGLRLDQAAANRVADEPGGFVDVRLLHDPRPVRLGGLEADPQQPRDLLR